jgi:hypothetical protein
MRNCIILTKMTALPTPLSATYVSPPWDFFQLLFAKTRTEIHTCSNANLKDLEAQYADELYRCLFCLTDGKCQVRSEFLYTNAGRINFFCRRKVGGLRSFEMALGRMNTSSDFRWVGKYGNWGVIKEHILLDFWSKLPSTHDYRRLYFINGPD